MDFWQAIASGFKNYVVFRGRACRSEYWYWVLAMIIGSIITAIIDYAAFGSGFGCVDYVPVNFDLFGRDVPAEPCDRDSPAARHRAA